MISPKPELLIEEICKHMISEFFDDVEVHELEHYTTIPAKKPRIIGLESIVRANADVRCIRDKLIKLFPDEVVHVEWFREDGELSNQDVSTPDWADIIRYRFKIIIDRPTLKEGRIFYPAYIGTVCSVDPDSHPEHYSEIVLTKLSKA